MIQYLAKAIKECDWFWIDLLRRAECYDVQSTSGQVHHSQPSRYIAPMRGERWTGVADSGPAFNQHWVNGSCLLGPHAGISPYYIEMAA